MPNTSSNRLFAFGFGYSVQTFAASLPPDEWDIGGTVRSPETRDRLSERGWDIHLFDGQAPLEDAASILTGTTHLIASAPPGPDGDPVLHQHRDDIAALTSLQWAAYLSTTGVYGDRDGDWVDEEAARHPTGPRGQRRVDAEDNWLALWRARQIPVHLFRLAGIYGPGRSALDTVRQGRARRIVKPGQIFSRIHVDDIAAVLAASMRHPSPGRAYNLCDDEAAPPQEVIRYACELLGVEPPAEIAFEDAEISDMARSFYRDNKRVSNTRIKSELGVQLTWPTFREGLQGLLA